MKTTQMLPWWHVSYLGRSTGRPYVNLSPSYEDAVLQRRAVEAHPKDFTHCEISGPFYYMSEMTSDHIEAMFPE